MSTHRTEFRLRNEPLRRFQVEASAKGHGPEGSVVKALVTSPEGKQFRMEIRFGGDYVATKPNFEEEDYLHASMSLIRGQIESHDHRDFRLSVTQASGLVRSEPASLDWTEVG